jgi:succinate dehydrogenase / fumarate reductase cytochrome b subunit
MAKPRPLSPHLQVYRPQLTSVMSIMHRATGIVLATGTVLLAAWLVALAYGPDSFSFVSALLNHPLGQFVLFGYSAALIYHSLNGIRHLGWDIGLGLSLPALYRNGQAVLIMTVVLTAALWSVTWML